MDSQRRCGEWRHDLVEIARRAVAKGKGFELDAKAQELLVRLRFQNDGVTVELRVKEVGEANFVVPGGVRQTQSIVHKAKEASCKIHGAEGGAVGSVPDFFRECDNHHAQSWTQWGAHRGSTNLFKNSSANGKLGHLQRHKDDAFNVPNEDLPGHIECTARAAE